MLQLWRRDSESLQRMRAIHVLAMPGAVEPVILLPPLEHPQYKLLSADPARKSQEEHRADPPRAQQKSPATPSQQGLLKFLIFLVLFS